LHPTLLGEDDCDVIFESVSYNFNQQMDDQRRQPHTLDSIDNTKETSDESLLPEYISPYHSNANAFLVTRLMKWVTILGGLLLLYFAYSYLSVHGWHFQLRRKETHFEYLWRMPGRVWRRMFGRELNFFERAIQYMCNWFR